MRTTTSRGRTKQTITGSALAALFLTGAANGASGFGAPSTGAAIFYTSALTIIAAFFLINFALKHRIGAYYAVLFALMLALVWVLEGGLSSAAPALSPDWQRSLSLTIGLIGAGAGYFTADRAIDPRRNMPRAHRVLTVLAAGSLLLIAGALVWPSDVIAMTANVLLIGMFVSHAFSASTWRMLDERPNRVGVSIAAVLLLAVVGALLIYGMDRQALLRDHVLRVLFTLAAAPTMGAIVVALIDMRRSRDRALEAAVEAARKDAATSAALLEMEKNYSRARDIAANRTRQISTASHDIRQPIASMRAELDVLKGEVATESVARLDRILNHLAALTDDLSRSAAATPESDAGAEDQAENVPAAHVFKMLERMFAAAAKADVISLRFVNSSKTFRAPAVALMRIGTNLLSNAIRHSHAKKIVVGLKRRGGTLRLFIADNGTGFPGSNASHAFEAGVKGAASAGSGLGLSIVRELAAEHGFDLEVRSVEGRGSAFTITIPSAR